VLVLLLGKVSSDRWSMEMQAAGANAKEDRICTLYLYTHAELLADSICNARTALYMVGTAQI